MILSLFLFFLVLLQIVCIKTTVANTLCGRLSRTPTLAYAKIHLVNGSALGLHKRDVVIL